MESNHTQGNWNARPNSIHTDEFVIFADKKLIARITPQDVTDSEIEANAFLIAAAPKLLEALKNAKSILNMAIDNPELMTEIDEALAKAQP